jgi:hypothetical protein
MQTRNAPRTTASAPVAPSLAQATLLHAEAQVHQLAKPRRAWPMLVVVLSLAVLGGLLASYSPHDRLAATDFFSSFGLTLIALVSIGYGASSVRGAAERGALSLYLLRPRGWLAWPLGTWLGTVCMIGAASVAAALLTLAAATVGALAPDSAHVLPITAAALLAGVGWSSIAMAVSAVWSRGAALCVVWLLVCDMGLSKLIDSLAYITPGPALSVVAQLPPEHLWLAAGSASAIAQLFAIPLVALATLIWRFHADPPT